MDLKHLTLEARLGLGMFVSQDMERPVDGQSCEFLPQGNGNLTGLTNRLVESDIDIAQDRLVAFVKREGDDVRGPITPEILEVEITNGLVLEQGDGDLPFFDSGVV